MNNASFPGIEALPSAEPRVMRGRLVVTVWKGDPPPDADKVPQRLRSHGRTQVAAPLDYDPPPFILP